MASVIHIAEIAALLSLAYMAGWAIGYLAHRLTVRPAKRVENVIPADRLAAVKGEAEALVKAPVIAPLPVQPMPPAPALEVAVAPQPEQAPAMAAPVLSDPIPPVLVEPGPVFAPAAVPVPDAIALTPLEQPLVPMAEIAVAPTPVVEPVVEIALPVPPPVATLPQPEPVPAVPFTAMPSTIPGQAWTGEIRGRAATKVTAGKTDPLPEAALEILLEPAAPAMDLPVVAERALPPAVAVEPAPAAAEPTTQVPPPITAAVVPPPRATHDEDAAMRAIEGGWSRVRARAMPGAPELSDVGAAVAAAQTAVEQVLAQAGIDPVITANTNKPIGLPRPRGGRKDDLKQVDGLTELDESTLNNLGIYHFHQIAGWDETEVLWMENHVFARGRIGREIWQDQARRLAETVEG
ncbi:MAG: hypothetical protein ABIQ30_18415 [Devosia sp.]